MHMTVTRDMFYDCFTGNQYTGNFSYWGLDELFDYLDNDDGDGNSVELDVACIACDFTEADATDIMREYDTGIELEDIEGGRTLTDVYADVQDWLEYRTIVIAHDGSGRFLFASSF